MVTKHATLQSETREAPGSSGAGVVSCLQALGMVFLSLPLMAGTGLPAPGAEEASGMRQWGAFGAWREVLRLEKSGEAFTIQHVFEPGLVESGSVSASTIRFEESRFNLVQRDLPGSHDPAGHVVEPRSGRAGVPGGRGRACHGGPDGRLGRRTGPPGCGPPSEDLRRLRAHARPIKGGAARGVLLRVDDPHRASMSWKRGSSVRSLEAR